MLGKAGTEPEELREQVADVGFLTVILLQQIDTVTQLDGTADDKAYQYQKTDKTQNGGCDLHDFRGKRLECFQFSSAGRTACRAAGRTTGGRDAAAQKTCNHGCEDGLPPVSPEIFPGLITDVGINHNVTSFFFL